MYTATESPSFWSGFRDGITKRAFQKDVEKSSRQKAIEELNRLKSLDQQNYGELSRGAAIGTLVAPVFGAAHRTISSGLAAAGSGGPQGIARRAAADALQGAVYGGAIPYVRNRLERHVARQNLKDYLDESHSSTTQRRVEKALGM